MKFLVDVQLPRRMCGWLTASGHDALHTMDLSLGNARPDEALIDQADAQGRVLVTKDDDFVQSRLVRGQRRLLWLIATGNIDNRAPRGRASPGLTSRPYWCRETGETRCCRTRCCRPSA